MNNQIAKYIYKITALILFALITNSCSKNAEDTGPIISIYNPEHKQLFLLPDTINIKYSVAYKSEIEYIRVSIVDKNMTSVTGQEFLYPEENSYNGDTYLPISILPQSNSHPPYYVQITVSTFSQINHTYQEISLLNNDIKYQGFFLIGSNNINTVTISSFNKQYQKLYSTNLSGNYSGSEISDNSNMLYLITNTPDRARAINCENGEIVWIKEPQLPYPQFNNVLVNNNIVYVSTAIGRIIGLTNDDGIQIFNTLVLPDSIPVNICITDDYLIADTRLRNSNSKVWVTYYKQTGSKYQTFVSNYETIAIFSLDSKNKIVAFCNNSATGHIIGYNAETNIIESNITVANIEIQQSCKIDDNNFLFSSANKLFHFNWQNKLYIKILETDDIIYDIKYDHVNSHLFITQPNKAKIYSYPQLNNIKTIETLYPLKQIELKYGY